MLMNTTDIRSMIRRSYDSVRKSKDTDTQKSGVITIKRSFNASRMLAQLANARTKSQVSAIERTVRALLPSMKRQNGSEEAVKQMKYVIQKANTKRLALSKEERLDNNRKIARSADNKLQEARLKSELEKKRMNRMRREVVDALNAPDVFEKNQYDSFTIGNFDKKPRQTIDVACDTIEVSTQISQSLGGAIDTLL